MEKVEFQLVSENVIKRGCSSAEKAEGTPMSISQIIKYQNSLEDEEQGEILNQSHTSNTELKQDENVK